ncbi:AbrB/MazE/SpoVT family DNA-binding domain-containing protein [Saliniramus fredricksonii]|nr:AbrB/MazE/SpoVT family DNA-binding domain-containing protein [Saliniramus fredricksonii]
MHRLYIISMGEATGMILPDDVMARFGASKGDTLCVIEASGCGYRLTMKSRSLEV